jgi:hypothetical protein
MAKNQLEVQRKETEKTLAEMRGVQGLRNRDSCSVFPHFLEC